MSQDSAGASYDGSPYVSHVYSESSPGRLVAVAELFGMEPRPEPVARCRVLELGCAQGNNLIAMAVALPDAEFLGVDVSVRQLDAGRRRIQQLGLENVRLELQDFSRFPADAGRYHYIIAHGIYSWISPAHRDAMLEVCRRHLEPNGVAYISYNVLPGWYRRLPVRDALLYHLRNTSEPQARIDRALELLEWLRSETVGLNPHYRVKFDSVWNGSQ